MEKKAATLNYSKNREKLQELKKYSADKYTKLIPGGGNAFFDTWQENQSLLGREKIEEAEDFGIFPEWNTIKGRNTQKKKSWNGAVWNYQKHNHTYIIVCEPWPTALPFQNYTETTVLSQ